VTQGEREVLVEEVLEKLAHSQVGPSSVDEQQALQVAELSHGEVACQYSLHAFLSADTDANVRRCPRNNHNNSVSTPDCRSTYIFIQGRLRHINDGANAP